MGFDQYHEPPEELSQEVRSFARVIASLTEEAEAIGWYEQRLSLEKDEDAVRIMSHAQKEEYRHFSMDLEWLLRRSPKWADAAQEILFTTGPIGYEGMDDDAKSGDESAEPGDELKSASDTKPRYRL